MPLLETDTEPEKAEDLLSQQEGSPGLLEAIRSSDDVQAWAFTMLLSLGGVWFAIDWYTGLEPALLSSDTGLFIGAVVVLMSVVLDSMDRLYCVLSSSHECRHCRDELARWEGAE